MINHLPKYWIVINDGSEEFRQLVFTYLDTLSNDRMKSWFYPNVDSKFYGVDKIDNHRPIPSAHNDLKRFYNRPKVLAFNEFKELVKPIAIESNEVIECLDRLCETLRRFQVLGELELTICHNTEYSEIKDKLSQFIVQDEGNSFHINYSGFVLVFSLTEWQRPFYDIAEN